MSSNNEPAVNERISSSRVLLIDESGRKLGEFLTKDAIKLAMERGMDLVEVQPNPNLPVCKIADYGKMKYERKKREKLNRKSQNRVKVKEIKIGLTIEDHDLKVWANKAKKILKKGDRVKFIVQFRGREISLQDMGREKCSTFQELCSEVAEPEAPPKIEGMNMSMTLLPIV